MSDDEVMMDYELGTITIRVNVDAFQSEDDEDLTIHAGSAPRLSLEIDLPTSDPRRTAEIYLRRVADQLASQT